MTRPYAMLWFSPAMSTRTGPPRSGTRFDDPKSPMVATELVTTRSPAAATDPRPAPKPLTCSPENPHIRFFNDRRGYVRCAITPDNCVPTSGCCLTFRGPTPRCRLQHRSS